MTDKARVSPAIGETAVEDKVRLRPVVAEYLRHCGYKVIGAAVAGEAILVLKQPHPKPYEPQSEHNRIR
jgi:hypothetical protein